MTQLSDRILAKLEALRPAQISRLESILEAWLEGAPYVSNPASDFATPDFCIEFGDILREHHYSSVEAFSKDKFEYGLRRALIASGHTTRMAPPGNPGEDLVVDGHGWSCKTQAGAQIRVDRILISKFMELGRGAWETEADIEALRQRMFDHMRAYERIMVLRRIGNSKGRDGAISYIYELVEIPKELLMQSRNFDVEIRQNSRQTPKPAVCVVFDDAGRQSYQLYFDGGTERKLQIQHIQKDLCIVHATWRFKAA